MVLLLGLLGPALAAVDVERAMADVRWLVEELGPRPAGSEAERLAAQGVVDRLQDAGWAVQARGCPLCVVACRGQPERLFLAHIDSVPGSPGAVDNAAGVAALLELARTTQGADLCLGFPPAEEPGLLGSEAMAEAWTQPLPELVVALDLAGHGQLSVTGFGPAWGAEDMRWVLAGGDVHSHYLYRAVSRLLPHMERSDHRSFARRGVRSLHLLGRSEGGVFPLYHQAEDVRVQPEALASLLRVLGRLASEPLPQGRPDAAATHRAVVIPAWIGHLLLLVCGMFALHDLVRPCEGRAVLGAAWGLLRSAGRTMLGVVALGLPLALCTQLGWMSAHDAERTAGAVMGLPSTGWWSGAPWGVGLGLLAWTVLRRRIGGVGSPTLAAFVLALLGLSLDPLLAWPFALAGLLARLHPLLGALPALGMLWPDHLRELAFHGLVPPSFWPVFGFLLWPAFGTRRKPSPTSHP